MDEKLEYPNIIVEGEASESDEDDTVSQNDSEFVETSNVELPVSVQGVDDVVRDNYSVTSTTGAMASTTGAVISGEASESEDEFEIVTNEDMIPPLSVNTFERGDTSDVTSPHAPPVQQRVTKPKYNTLLNRKLRERNVALRRHIVDTVHQSYTLAAKDLHNLTLQLQKSHIAIQDVSHNMRNTTNDLFHLEDKVDIVRSCNILPEIAIPSTNLSTVET